MHRVRSSLAGPGRRGCAVAAAGRGAGQDDGLPLPRHRRCSTPTRSAPQEAKDKGCRTIEGAPITVIQAPRPRAGAPAPAAAAPRAGRRQGRPGRRSARATATPAASSRPSCGARKSSWRELQKEYNNGEPERRGDERNYQKYLDRVAEMKAAIARKESDIAALKRETRQAAAVKRRRAAGRQRRRRADAAARLRGLRPCWPRWWRWSRPTAAACSPTPRFENVLGLSRRSVLRGSLFDWFVDPRTLRDTRGRGGAQRVRHQPLRRAAAAPGADRRRAAAGARHRQPDRPARPRCWSS